MRTGKVLRRNSSTEVDVDAHGGFSPRSTAAETCLDDVSGGIPALLLKCEATSVGKPCAKASIGRVDHCSSPRGRPRTSLRRRSGGIHLECDSAGKALLAREMIGSRMAVALAKDGPGSVWA
jgi:hypothetical protein